MDFDNPGREKAENEGFCSLSVSFFCPVFVITYPVSLVSLIRMLSFPKKKSLGAVSLLKNTSDTLLQGLHL